jgi:hypothetical protein
MFNQNVPYKEFTVTNDQIKQLKNRYYALEEEISALDVAQSSYKVNVA